ncbi:glucosaminidase domain-containing protein [Patulibacter sp. NPDC049589]|uniref:glucosaminidase domain-containing protein n=1 Tax=Patulibacter sp. NPDC049589 TaxID=3154731 RepID=UPI00341DEBBB
MRVSRPVLLTLATTGLCAASTAPTATASVATGPRPVAEQGGAATTRAFSPVGIVRLDTPGGVLVTRLDPQSPVPGPPVTDGQNFVISCQSTGERKDGRFGASRVWDQVQLPTGEVAYLPDALTETSTKDVLVAPFCGGPAPSRVGGTQGQCFVRRPIKLLRAPRSRAAFLKKAGPEARRTFRAARVPASVTLAQAILESGDGTKTADANNYFGIKAQSANPATGVFVWGRNAVGCMHEPTNESEGGTDVRQVAQFRLYRTMRGSFVDHGLFLRENPRYARAFKYRRSPRRFAQALQKAGYATDPGYATKLITLIKQDKLTRWD